MMPAFISHLATDVWRHRRSSIPGQGLSSSFAINGLRVASPLKHRTSRQIEKADPSHIVASTAPIPANTSKNGVGTGVPTQEKSLGALREILQGVYELSLPLWNGKRKAVAWAWTAATLVLALLATLYAVMLSMIQRFFWNALNARDVSKFGKILQLYALAVITGPIVLSLFEWVKERLALMWRRSLTEHLMARYFTDLNYYKLSLGTTNIDNPDQRISEDVMKFTSRAVRFLTIIGVGVFDLLIFSVILYKVYSPLFYLLIAYSAIGTIIIAYTGQNLLRLNRQQVSREADYRYGLVRVRESTESIAFYAGETAEKGELISRFTSAFRNNISLLGLKRNVYFVSASFRYYAQVVPTAVIAPKYFAGTAKLGTISQVYFSFNHVLSSLGLIVSEFSALSEFSAGIRRLKSLSDALKHPGDASQRSRISTNLDENDDARSISLSHVSVETPSDPPRNLVRDLSLAVSPGERLLVVGRSGIGKSSLMRAVCGLWDSGTGDITRPSHGSTLFLPQRPFVMLGSLRENVIYPTKRNDVSTEEVEAALDRVNLGYIADAMGGLDAPGEALSRRLSLGEQQRLAFARIVISKPRLVILDESSSALDLENEQDMYSMIKELGVTCISVGNRPSLLDFHEKILRLGGDGSWSIETPEAVKKAQRDGSIHV